jgi:capsular exopolysaccharide synthesis family protein
MRREATTMRRNGFVTIAGADPNTPFVEAYGLLLASVLLGKNGGTPPSVVAVTAPQVGEGTTTTALNLALMMAQTGRRTVLVDGNLRAPELHQAFKVPASPGLAEVLAGQADWGHAVHATTSAALALVPAGKVQMPMQFLLAPQRLSDAFTALRQRFDLVVVDTPPVLRHPDALHFSKCVDGVVVVVAPARSSRRDQQETRRLLARVDAHVLGTVLNRVPAREQAPLAGVL